MHPVDISYDPPCTLGTPLSSNHSAEKEHFTLLIITFTFVTLQYSTLCNVADLSCYKSESAALQDSNFPPQWTEKRACAQILHTQTQRTAGLLLMLTRFCTTYTIYTPEDMAQLLSTLKRYRDIRRGNSVVPGDDVT